MSDIIQLADEDNLKKARKEAEKQAGQFTMDHYKMLRRLGKTNLFFLATNLLGYTKLSDDLHGHFATWKMRTDKEFRFRLTLLPRAHYKSTIDTIADSIRCALPDDVGDLPWPECLGTDIRLMIGHETADMAARFLVSIAGHFMSNPLLMGLYPECVPSPRKQRINNYQLELPRKGLWPEPTFDTMGVGAKSQGRHYNKLKLDDLIGDKARDSKREMETAIEWFDNIQAFFSDFLRDEFDVIGTRWAFDDIYSHMMKTYGPALGRYIRSAIEKNAQGQLVPIFPEAFTLESFEIIKKNPRIWNSQYANNPELLDAEFLPQWLRYFNWRNNKNEVVIFNKQHSGVIAVEQYHTMRDMDRVILIDPALTGLAGIMVTGMTANGRVFTLDAIKGSFRPPELVEKIFQLVSRWQPRLVAIEEVLFSEIYRHWLEREMQVRGIRFHVQPVKTKGQAKEARIRGLANYYAAGNIYHEQTQMDLLEEFKTFGRSVENKHLLDAFAYGPALWVKPWTQQQWQDIREQENQQFNGRASNTGY